jgi:YVTN family beta-propeller protein
MKKHLSIKSEAGVKKTGLIFSGILVLFLILASSTASAAPFAYVTNQGSSTVSVINTATNTFTATVHVGSGPGGVAVNPAGTKVYVANYWDR